MLARREEELQQKMKNEKKIIEILTIQQIMDFFTCILLFLENLIQSFMRTS